MYFILDISNNNFVNDYIDNSIDNVFNTFNIDYTYGVPISIAVVVLIALLLAAITIKKILFKTPSTKKYDESTFLQNEQENMKDYVYNEYIKILKYMSDEDISNLNRCVDPFITQSYIEKINKLKTNNYKRIMSDFRLIYCSISYVHKEDDKQFIEAILTIELKDYIVDCNNTVVSGSKDNLVRKVFSLMFERNTICPKCGGEIDFNYSMCTYCRAKIGENDYYSVLKKQKYLK